MRLFMLFFAGTVLLPAQTVRQAAVVRGGGQSVATRDWRLWPFSEKSPWNTPIGSGARYKSVPRLTAISVGMNYDDRWTSAIFIAKSTDPLAPILFGLASGPQSNWMFLANGGKTCGNSLPVEAPLLSTTSTALPFPANYYSTLATPNTNLWILPSNYEPASLNYQSVARLPVGACPSPDTDALMAVFQPNGLVLDTINTVVTSDGSIVTSMASYVDAKGDGTGWVNGRRASMIPSFAGLIRTGEISSDGFLTLGSPGAQQSAQNCGSLASGSF